MTLRCRLPARALITLITAATPLAAQTGAVPLPTAQTVDATAAPLVELRGGRWFTGRGFRRGSRWMQGGRFVPRPAIAADSVVSLDGRWLVPPYADAHTHSPDGAFGFDGIRDMYLSLGVFYVQVLANHRSGRRALAGRVNVPASIDAVFADGAVTSSGGHPHVLYEELALYRTLGGTPEQRQRAARSLTQDGDVYHRLDSLPQLGALITRLRRDTVPLMKVMVLRANEFARLTGDTSEIGSRGIDARVLRPLVDSAHAMGRRVWVHVETAADFELGLDAGVDGFAHVPGYGVAYAGDVPLDAYRLTDAMIRKAATKRVLVIPTLGLSWTTQSTDSAAWRRTRMIAHENVRRLVRAGVTVLTGSDTYSSVEAIENDHRGLAYALQLSPLQQLRLRAFDTPRGILPGRRIGALDVGYEASLLALQCDPL
ncbi:MAG TPA: hypothetical protein VE861_03310, partial [Gemmatimonadaceae bacterium]|nr:hypothetical protein [Gemmatimonadaceae bacterium]